MKSFRFRLLIAALAVVLGSAIARSQTTDAPPSSPTHSHRFGMRAHRVGFFAKQLNLTDEQKTKMKALFEESHTSMKPLMQQSRQIEQQIHQYAEGSYDEAKVRTLATQKAQVEVDLKVAQTRVHNQTVPVADPGAASQAERDGSESPGPHAEPHASSSPLPLLSSS